MEIAFGATIGNISPILILFNSPKLCKPIQNSHFKVFRMEINSVLKESVECLESDPLQTERTGVSLTVYNVVVLGP